MELPCAQCPALLFGEPDYRSRLVNRFIEYLNATPVLEQGVPWELICAMAGIRDLDTLREVWMRLGIIKEIGEARRKLLESDASPHDQDEG